MSANHITPGLCRPVLGPASHLILYHYVVEGEFRLRVEGENAEPLILKTGEVVMLPRNDLHLMGSDLSMPPIMSSLWEGVGR
jgi:quercetin dioxygenase-like cupin family protein